MAELFLQVAHHHEPDPELIAGRDQVPVQFGELRELEHDHLGHAKFLDGAPKAVRTTEHGDLVFRAIERFLANNADRPQAHLRLAPEPAAKLRGLRGRADEESFFFPPKNFSGQKFRQEMVGKQERDIKPGDEIEEENSRDEAVLGRDQVKDEQADAGKGLAQGEAMLAQQFALEKISLRAFPAERFPEQADDEHRAINAVAPPGELGPFRVKGHHHPDPKPEKPGHDRDLAKQKKAIQSLRALGQHGYRLGITTAVGTAESSLVRSPEERLVRCMRERKLVTPIPFHRN